MKKSDKARAIIVTIGDEILIGQTRDTNSYWLAKQLHSMGIQVLRIIAVSDREGDMERALSDSIEEAGLVVCTGGLGPTRDDRTKTVLAKIAGTQLEFNEEAYNWIRERKEQEGKKPNELHRRQSYLPVGFEFFKNRRGTAPGMMAEINGSFIVSVPGVPYEMKELMSDQIFPLLRENLPIDLNATRTLLTAGIAESELAGQLSEFEDNLPEGVSLAWLPGHTRVRIRVTSRASDIEEAGKTLDKYVDKIYGELGSAIYGEDDDTLEEILFEILKEKGLTLATAESCTGGYIAHLLTSVPGVSACFKGSIVAYSNEIKERVLGVKVETLEKYGAVSEETVREMLEGICREFETDLGIAISGIAGPDGGSREKPVGTVWVAVGSPESQRVELLRLNLNRKLNIEKSGLLALNMLRLFLSGD